MLWYKSLREIRTVTLFGMAAMAIACVLIVLNEQAMRAHAEAPTTYIAYIWKSVYNSFGRDLYVILSIILGSGGLLQERAHGTQGFTLALPVSRRRLVFVRAVVGFCGVLAIAAVPVVITPLASRYVGEQYPISQAAGFFALWAGCGAVFYGLTFLLAHRIEGEYISVLLAIPSLLLYGALTDLPWLQHLRMLDIFDVITGEDMPFFNEARHLMVGPLPWLTVATMVAAGSAFAILAARRIEKIDF